MKIKYLVTSLLLFEAICQPQKNITQEDSEDTFLFVLFAICAIISLLILYDRRQGYTFLIAGRQKIRLWCNQLKTKITQLNKKKQQNRQKLGSEEQSSTAKGTIGFLDSEKTYCDADIASIQETANTNSSLPDDFKNMNIEEETPQVNLKQAFEKQKKTKDSKKSRSKLRNRVQIKKSQLQENNSEPVDLDVSAQLERSVQMSNGNDEVEG